MKTQVQLHDPKSQDFDETERLVEIGQVKGLALATHDAGASLLKGTPQIPGITLELLTSGIYAHYNSLLTTVNSVLDAKLQIQQGAAEKIKVEAENHKLSLEKNKAQQEYKLLKYLVPDKGTKQIIIALIVDILLLIFILGAELVFMSRSLQLIAQNFLSALIMGAGITIAIATIGYLGGHWIKQNIKTVTMRRLARATLCFLILAAFIALAILRNGFLKETTNSTVPVWAFVGLNVFLFLALYFITELWIVPLINKAKDAFTVLRAKRKADKKQSLIIKLYNLIEANTTRLSAFLNIKMSMVHRHINRENEIDKMYHEAISLFKQTALCVNHDGTLPAWLKEEPKQLDFFTTNILNETKS